MVKQGTCDELEAARRTGATDSWGSET